MWPRPIVPGGRSKATTRNGGKLTCWISTHSGRSRKGQDCHHVRRQGLDGAELRRDPVRSVMDTLGIGINVLEAAAQARLERFILLSSCTGYPEGPSPKEEGVIFAGEPPPN
jgi:hypothetical protein